MLRKIGPKIISALLTSAITVALFFILFLGIKYSAYLKKDVLLKAASNTGMLSAVIPSQIPIPPEITGSPIQFSQSDIANIAQSLNLSATTTQDQINGIQDLQTNLLPSLLKNDPAVANLFDFPPIKDSDIKISSSPNAGQDYIDKVNYYFKNDLPAKNIPPLALLLMNIAANNPDLIPLPSQSPEPSYSQTIDLNPYIVSYQKLFNDIKSLAVPKPWVALHKQELLALQATVASFQAINLYPQDKLAIAFALQSLEDSSQSINNAINSFDQSLSAQWSGLNK